MHLMPMIMTPMILALNAYNERNVDANTAAINININMCSNNKYILVAKLALLILQHQYSNNNKIPGYQPPASSSAWNGKEYYFIFS